MIIAAMQPPVASDRGHIYTRTPHKEDKKGEKKQLFTGKMAGPI